MKQHLATTLAVLSLAIFCLFLFLWVWSYVNVRCVTNGIALVPRGHSRLDMASDSPNSLQTYLLALQDRSDVNFSFLGFRYQRGGATSNAAQVNAAVPNPFLVPGPGGGATLRVRPLANFWVVVIPYWFLMLLSAVGPAWWLFVRQRRDHRERNGLCLRCGYDLRESKDKCPECGTPVPARASVAA